MSDDSPKTAEDDAELGPFFGPLEITVDTCAVCAGRGRIAVRGCAHDWAKCCACHGRGWVCLVAPPWAIGAIRGGELVTGAQLCTRDGRAIGNAVIVGREADAFVVVTDAGSTFAFTASEIRAYFWPPVWRMDPRTAPGVVFADVKRQLEKDLGDSKPQQVASATTTKG